MLGVETVLAEARGKGLEKQVSVSFDIDSVDPAFTPCTGTPEVGGFSTYEALQLVRAQAGLDLFGFDFVEVSPPYDHGDITAILASNPL
jgi:arginase family enzyme